MILHPTVDVRRTARQRRREQAHFEKVRNAQQSYATQLRKVANQIEEFIGHYSPITPAVIQEVEDILNRYAYLIRPWAVSTARQMITEVARRDATAWQRHAREIGGNLRYEIQNTSIGAEAIRIQNEQVELITSLPLEAARQVQVLAREAYLEGTRYEETIDEIERQLRISEWVQNKTGQQVRNRATLIARTEVGKTATAITQARAKSVGADSYIWRTARDADVRPKHRGLEGSVQRWDDPPEAEENGARHHPGEFPNCRCWSEPIIDEIV